MRVVLSVQEGKISSATLLRRLSTYSRRNNIYQAFREIGRAIRTVQLLRFLSDAQLRRRTTAETNKVESYNNFSSWCRFGNAGVIAANDPEEQEKILKFSTLMTNAVIFHTTVDMMTVIRELIAEGWQITPADVRDRRHPALRGLCHRRDRPDPRTLQRPPGHRPGRRILSSPDPAPSFRNRPWRVLGLSWLHPYYKPAPRPSPPRSPPASQTPPSRSPAPSPTGWPAAATRAAAATPTPAAPRPLPPVDPQENGKTATRILTDDQLADYAPWFDNHRRLRELITELEELSLAIAEADPRWNR